MEFKWEDGFVISVKAAEGTALISSNREGLISLANHLLKLADEEPGTHFHLDRYNSLENGSDELIIEKTE